MSSDIPSNPTPSPSPGIGPPQPLLERLGLSGQLIGGGAIVGIIALFLPLMSVSVDMTGGGANPFGAMMGGGLAISKSVSGIEDWRGKLCLLAYAGAIVLVLAVYPTKTPQQKPLGWGALGAGGAAVILALWQLYLVKDAGGGATMPMGSVKTSIGFGGFLNLIAAGVASYGGYLKAREEGVL